MSAGPYGTAGSHPGTPRVSVAESIAVPAGSTVIASVVVTNTADRAADQTLTLLGLDAAWVGEPIPLGTLAPGETLDVAVPITPERGAIGAGYPFVVAVESRIGGTAMPLLGIAESTLVVDGRERISLTIDPSTATAVRGRRIRLQLTNPGRTDREITLAAESGTQLRIGLDRASVVAPAGRTVTVDGKIRIRRPHLLTQGGAHSFSITARSSGAPEQAQGTLRAVPLVRGAVMRAVSLILVVALWAGAAILLIPRLSDTFSAKNDVSTAAPSAAQSAGGAPSGGTGAGAGASAGAGTDNGADGSAGPDGSGGSGDGTDGTDAPDATTAGSQLVGTIGGPDPSGVSAQLQPTSLVAASEAGATAADPGTSQGLRASDAPLGKIPEQAVQPVSPRQSAPEGTRSGKDGSFAFGGIQAPGYYLLTLSKKGLQTQRYVVDSSTLAGADPLQVTMVAGSGTLTGAVTGPDGPIGAASVEITDGTISLSTSSVSAGEGVPSSGAGAVGSWSAAGLSTPGTYLVTVSAPGYGTSSSLVTLATGGAGTADLTLQRGVAAVTGSVTGRDALGNLGGLGGISISLTDGETTRTATTVTSGPIGQYVLAGVPAPGEYTMTVSGAGYQTQTRTVTIGEGVGAVTADVALVDAMGSVTGRALDENGSGISGVGLTLVGDTTSYKTMSTSAPAGRYRFTGVAPGTYLLTATQFGRAPASTTVTVTAPDVAEQDLTLAQDADLELIATARIRGRVVDASTDGALTCTRVAVPGRPCRVTVSTSGLRDAGAAAGSGKSTLITSSAGPEEDYTLPNLEDTAHRGLAPGLYTLRIAAPGYESTQIQVQVSQGQITVAQQVGLQPLARISGAISTRVGTPASPTCVLSVATGVTAPTACTVAEDGDSCTPAGGAVVGLRCAVVAADGSYQIVGLVHGSYRVTVLPTDPEYRPIAPATVQLALGDDAAFNGVLDRLGRATVTVFRPDQSTLALSPSAAAAVRLTARDGALEPVDADAVTGASGQASFDRLNGTYTVTADSASTTIRTALNQTTVVSIVVTSRVGPVVGRITTSVDGQIVPVDGARVTIGGIIGFSGQTPVTGTAAVTTDAAGCYAIVPEGYAGTPVLVSPDCPTPVVAGSRAVLQDSAGDPGSLVALPITLSVDASGTRTKEFASQAYAIDGSGPVRTVPVVVVSAQPSPAGTQVLRPKPDGVQATLIESRIVVTARPAGAGAVAVTSDAAGNLTFVDPSLGTPGLLVPGRYSLTASLDDFVSGTADLLCPLGETCVLVQPGTTTPIVGGLELRVLPSMDVTVHVIVPTGETLDVSGLAASVAAVSATGAGTLSLTAADPVVETGGYRVRFSYTDSNRGRVQVAVPGTYDLSFSLNGYTGAAQRVSCGADYTIGCTKVDLTLKPFPRLAPDARVISQPGSTTVQTARVLVLSRPAGSGAVTVTVADGVVSWQEGGLPADVIRPGSYQFQVTADGQDQSSPASYTCDRNGDLVDPASDPATGARSGTCSPPWELTQRTDMKFVFVDAQGPVNDVRIVLSGSGLSSPATAATQASGNIVTIQNVVALPGVAAGYSLRVQAAGFQFQDLTSASGQITCSGSAGTTRLQAQPGGTTTCVVTLNPLGRLPITTAESITPPSGEPSENVLGSVALTAQRISNAAGTTLTGQPIFSRTTSTDGRVSITGGNNDEGLLAGTYRVSATADGHDPVTGTVQITQTGSTYTMTAVSGSFPITDGSLHVVLPVTKVDVKLNLASVWDVNTPLLQPLTATFTGAGGTYSCVITSTGSTPADCAVDDATGKYVAFDDINPGTYQLTIDPPNAANPTFFSFSQRIDIPRASPGSTTAEFTVYLYVRSNTQVVKVLDPTGAAFTRSATIAFLKDGPSGKIPATDYDGTEITRTVSTGTWTFTQVPDGRYYIQITSDGYDTITSEAIDLIKFLTPVQPQREFTLARSGRSVNFTVESTARTGAGTVVDQAGTTILLTQTSAPGNLPAGGSDGPLTVSGPSGGPYTTFSSGALNTGGWAAATQAQAGLRPDGTATALPAQFTSAATAFTVTPGNTPQQQAIRLRQRVLTMTATFSPTDCTRAAPLPADLPIVITHSSGAKARVSAVVDNTAGTITASATLPAGTYTWAPDLSAVNGYTFTPAAAASTLSVPAGAAQNSLAPVTSTAALTYATGPVSPTLEVDDATGVQTTVTATDDATPTPNTRTLTTGVVTCLAPGAWTFSIGTESLLLPDVPGTVTTTGVLAVPFVGFTLQPVVSLATVNHRPPDPTARSYGVRVSSTALAAPWTGTLIIPAGATTIDGPLLTVPTGSYTAAVTSGPTDGNFATTGTSAAVNPATAAGTDKPTVTLGYLRSTLYLTATLPTGATAPTTGTVTLIPTAGGIPLTRTVTGAGPYTLADLPPGSYDLYLQSTGGTQTYTASSPGLVLATGSSVERTVALVEATDGTVLLNSAVLTGATATFVPTGAGAVVVKTLSGTGRDLLTGIPTGTYDVYVQGTTGTSVRLGTSTATVTIGLSTASVTVPTAAVTDATLIVRPDIGAVTTGTVTLLRPDGTVDPAKAISSGQAKYTVTAGTYQAVVVAGSKTALETGKDLPVGLTILSPTTAVATGAQIILRPVRGTPAVTEPGATLATVTQGTTAVTTGATSTLAGGFLLWTNTTGSAEEYTFTVTKKITGKDYSGSETVTLGPTNLIEDVTLTEDPPATPDPPVTPGG